MNFLRFLISKSFWINLILMLLLSAVLVFATLTFLKIYTQHGISENVPDLSGMTFEEANDALKHHNFRLAVHDSTFVNGKKANEIINQDPVAGSSVKKSRKIYLTVNASKPPETKLPDILDSSLKNAREQLTSRGLLMGDIEQIPGLGEVVKKIKVKGEEKLPGEPIFKGTMVDLVVTDGIGTRKIDVPFVIGQTFTEAKAQLRLRQLDVGAVVKDNDVTDISNAYVYKQTPNANSGNLINIGGTVDLYLQTEEIFDDQIDYLDESDYDFYDPNTGEYRTKTNNNSFPNNQNNNSNSNSTTPQGNNTNTNSSQNTESTSSNSRDLFKRKK